MAVDGAVRALLQDDQAQAYERLLPLEHPQKLFLACAYMTRQIARVLPEGVGEHECVDPICPVATDVLDTYLRGERKRSLGTISQLIAADPDRAVLLMQYLLSGVVTAVQAGRLTAPQNPERN